MAAVISDLANGVSVASDTACATGATVTAAIDNWLVVVAASSNDGTGGAASQTDVVDSDGVNVYTQQALINNDPGAAGAGATFGFYTCPVTSTLALDTITVNHSVNTNQKAVQVYLVVPGVGEAISFVAVDATGITGNATVHGVATVSVTDGDTIFGAASIETDDAVTGDTDTTNGNWSSVITRLADAGSDTSAMTCSSQYKTVNATGNQAWACTTAAARDSARTYLVLRSAVASADFSLTKTLGALTSSATATVGIDASVSKTLGALASTAAASVDIDASLAKTLGALTVTATVEATNPGDAILAKTLGALTLSSAASVNIDAALAKTLGTLVSSSTATVGIDASLAKTLGTLALSGTATLDIGATLAANLGALTGAGAASLDIDGTLSKTLASLVLDADATVEDTGSNEGIAAITLGALMASAVLFKWDRQDSVAGTWASQSGGAGTWTEQSETSGSWSTQ